MTKPIVPGVASAIRASVDALEAGPVRGGKLGLQLHQSQVMGQLVGALTCLAEHWGMTRENLIACIETIWDPSELSPATEGDISGAGACPAETRAEDKG